MATNFITMEKFETLMRNLLKEQEDRITASFRIELQRLTKRIDTVEVNVMANKVDIKNINKQVNDLKESINFNEDVTEKKIKELHDRTDEVNAESDEIWDQLRQLEDRNRRSNLRIGGIDESEDETSGDVEEKVKKLFKDTLKIEDEIEIERAHRTGPIKKNGKPRTIVMKLLRYVDKTKILKNGNKLKNTDIWISEDFSGRTVDIRKKLLKDIKRREGNGETGMILVYDKIRKKKVKINKTNQHGDQHT